MDMSVVWFSTGNLNRSNLGYSADCCPSSSSMNNDVLGFLCYLWIHTTGPLVICQANP
jgi:hypothetical protein